MIMLVKPYSRDQLDMAIKLGHWDQQVEHFEFFKKQITACHDYIFLEQENSCSRFTMNGVF